VHAAEAPCRCLASHMHLGVPTGPRASMACIGACCTDEEDTSALDIERRGEGSVSIEVTGLPTYAQPSSSGWKILGTVKKEDGSPPQVAKTPEDAAPPPECIAFIAKVHLNRGLEAGFGLDFAEGNSLRVCHIFPKGPVPQYNEMAALDRRILVGDFIVGVDGSSTAQRDAQALLTALQKGGELELDIRRPYEFTISNLDKNGGPLGLDLSYHPRGTSVAVRAVFETGAVPTYNRTAPPEQQVKVSDYIVSVNGKTGTANELVQSFGDFNIVTFVVARPACM